LILYGTFPAGPRAAPNSHLPDGVFPDEWKEFGEKFFVLRDHWGEGMVFSVFAPSATDRLQRRAGAMFERAAASPAMLRLVIESAMRADVRDILPSIRVPTLVLHRTDENMPIELGRELAERIPGARFVEMSGADHMFWYSDYDGIASEIERFLTGGRVTRAPDRALTTVLFTDIVDSTRRAAELGDAEWHSLLIRHNATVHAQVESFDGRVVKLLGDGTLATFDSPAGAVRCAIQLRDSLGSSGLPIRAGVHTGECEMIGEDIGGMAVHIGARVSALAQNGEILVSSTVADLVIGSGLHFEERGSHELKGVPGQWRLMAVAGERLPTPTQEPLIRQRPSDRVAMRLGRRFPGAVRAILDAQRQ
jgi:class 3 adenylate cyclase